MNCLHEVEIVKVNVDTKEIRRINDWVAEERPLNVFLNRKHYATIICSPLKLKELAVGHLVSEGILKSVNEIASVDLNEKECVCRISLKSEIDLDERLKASDRSSRIVFTACGGGATHQYPEKIPRVKSDLRTGASTVFETVNRLNVVAETFRKTGGVHVAAVCGPDGTLVTFAEDVGRHNAVDKVIGSALLEGIDLNDRYLVLSGRLTGDVVMKSARVQIPIIASLAAATDSGIRNAELAGVTLIGFVRGKRMNIYSNPERILL
jgi:FdhD protein